MAMSPYAQSLLDLMQTAPTEVERAKAEVLYACYWARVGDHTTAEEIRQRSRNAYPSGKYGEVTVMHMCLDGLMHYYADQSPSAVDRLRSAHALAASFRFRREQAFSAAWLAHVEFNRDRWQAMAEALRSCRAALDRDDKATEGRLSLVIADALQHAGESRYARKWYEHAHRQFTTVRDHAAIEAFLYNGAALRLHSARLESIAVPLDGRELTRLGGEIASATNYQRITNQRSLDYLLAAAKASHQVLLKDYGAAKQTIRQLLEEGEIPKASMAEPQLLADLALCEAMLEETTSVKSAIEAAESAAARLVASDDLAIASNSIAIACERSGLLDKAAEWSEKRDAALLDFTRTRDDLRSHISEWLAEPDTALTAINR